jgi:D-beta-D-heptose 7-phosphate kinase/D-beta-D-heptose 1-phosphate adenosyltransferase
MTKIVTLDQLRVEREHLRRLNQRVVLTNGCFDLLHPGHVRYLQEARKLGEILIVALNSDRSVRELKGPGRPILNEDERSKAAIGQLIILSGARRSKLPAGKS